jgi:DNA-binding transcriptional LysR family regulator
VLRRLKERYPEIEITVRTGNSAEILAALADNMLDAAVVTLPASGRSFAVTPLVTDEMVAIFAAADAPSENVTPPFFVRQKALLLYETAGNSRGLIDQWFRQGGEWAKPGMELGNIEAIKKMVGAGLGPSIVPAMAVAEDHQGLAVRSLLPRLERQLGLVLRRDKVPDRALKAVIAALEGLART